MYIIEDTNNKYISDIVDLTKLKKDCFNIIASACGTGKSFFIENDLLNHLADVKPCEVIFVTSRSIIVDQQTRDEDNDRISKFDAKNIRFIRKWNGEDRGCEVLDDNCIQTMTYDKLIYILNHCNTPEHETLKEIKVVVMDECHTIFSDTFIRDIAGLKIWIRGCMYLKEKIFLGLTATPRILFYNEREWGVKINQLNSEILVRYRVQNLYCTSYLSLPQIFSDNILTGKTIIMCYSIDDCYELRDKIPNSAVLVSRSNKKYKDSMDSIRDYIVGNASLPDTVNVDGKVFDLNVLITTSTLREGINLNESSGVKNVICCIPDELHVCQFVGRCRFNIENLIIANEYMPISTKNNRYVNECRQDFLDYVDDRNNREWIDSIGHLLENPNLDPKFIYFDETSFFEYINENWLDRRIISKEDREYIANIALSCNLIKGRRSLTTFNSIMEHLENSGKYQVISKRCVVDGKKYTYKTIKLKEIVDGK